MKTLFPIKPRATRGGFSVAHVALAAIIAAGGLAGSAVAHAQATAGKVFGNAPAGSTVLAKSTTNGTQREVHVDDKGRYTIRELPVGIYTVTLSENGQPVARHLNVPVVVGRGIKVDFDGEAASSGQH